MENATGCHLTPEVREAARRMKEASFIIVAAGAGMSADSGLPTYSDIASIPAYVERGVTYGDLCRVPLLKEDPALFVPFWGRCFDIYRDTAPHDGYDLVREWCEKVESGGDGGDGLGRYHVYTSNVDSAFVRAGFPAERVCDMHGNCERWVCTGDLSFSVPGTTRPKPLSECARTIEVPPADFRFGVNPETMTLRDASRGGLECRRCKAPMRPAVLMFGDEDPAVKADVFLRADRYQAWEGAMEEYLHRHHGSQLVILEIGAGVNVPSVRRECEEVLNDVNSKGSSRAHLVRVNMDPAAVSSCEDPATPWESVTTILGGALHSLLSIQRALEENT